MRHTISPPGSPNTLSPRKTLCARVRARPVPKGPENPPTWPLTPQAPVRSALASINIVMACTSSLMITSALGSAVTISLPYVGKDLNIQKGDLQWVLSAYSISSVSILCSTASQRLAYLTLTHRLASFSFVGDLQIFTDANSSGSLDI